MAQLDDYQLWTQNRNKVKATSAALLLDNAAATNPDQYAGAIELGKAFGVPPALAAEGSDLFTGKLRRKKNELLLGTSPVLSRWLENEDNARVAHDDVESLGWFEGFARGAGNTLSRAGSRVLQVKNEYFRERFVRRAQAGEMSFGELVNSDAQQGPDGEAYPVLGDVISGTARWLDARLSQIVGTDDAELARGYTAELEKNLSAMAAAPKSQIAQDFQKLAMGEGASFGQAAKNFASAIASNPVGALSFAFETMGEAAPQLALSVGVSAATRNPSAGIAVIGAGSYVTERYTSPAEFFTEKGMDFKNSADVERLLSDPALMKEAAERGVIRGSVVALFDMVSGGVAGKTLASNPAVEAMAQSLSQAVLGASGEATARLAAGQDMDWNEVLAEGMAEFASTPIEMGIAGHSMFKRKQKAKEAERVQGQMAELSQAAAGSKLKQRPGGKFQEWISAVTGGTPKEDVYVPAEVLNTYFQSNGIDIDAFFQDLSPESGKQFDLAVATGGDVKIPTAAYAAKIVGSDLEPILQEHVRFDAGGMTFAEAKAFNDGVDDSLQDAFDVAERERDYDEGLKAVENQVYDRVVYSLRAAGREATIARSEAMVWPAFYRAMAERSGYTAEEMLAKFPLPKIRGAIPEGMSLKNVDEVNRTLAEARSFKAPKVAETPFLEWLDRRGGVYDDGGELKSRDAFKVKRKSKKTLRLGKAFDAAQGSMMGAGGREFKHTIEGAMKAAIADGFFADDPTVIKYQESVRNGTETPDLSEAFYRAVDSEMGGRPVGNSGDPESRIKLFDDLGDYLDRLGVSLSDPDDVIKAAMQADEVANGTRFEQDIANGAINGDPLLSPDGDWRNAEIEAVTEDGDQVTVLAGDAIDLLNDRIKAAQEILDCVRG